MGEPVIVHAACTSESAMAPTARMAEPQTTTASTARPGEPEVPHDAPSTAASSEPTPQLELDFSVPPAPPARKLERPQPVPPSAGDLHALIGPIVRLLGEVVGEAVRQGIEAAVAQMQQVHARERDALAQRFEAALERQDSRLRDLLEHQDARLNATLAEQARQHAEAMRNLVGEALAQHPAGSPSPNQTAATEVLDELQEILRLGFGEVRGALDRHHHELMNIVRAELRPLAQAALTHLSRPTSETSAAPAPKPPAPDGPSAVSTSSARASPARPPPAHDERAASQRRHAAIQEFDDDDDVEDPEENDRRPPHCRAPNDLDRSNHLEANP